jgi:hypothetical protein
MEVHHEGAGINGDRAIDDRFLIARRGYMLFFVVWQRGAKPDQPFYSRYDH